LAYYVGFAPAGTTLAELAAVAGLRWTIEACFETAKDELGLDHCEARSWHAWHRHVTLVIAAMAFLAKLRADLLRASMLDAAEGKRNERSPRAGTDASRSPQLGVTVPAIRYLLARALFLKPQTRNLLFRWADWRLRHNETARKAHYRKRSNAQL
jgi:hypothetical protein